MNAGEDDLAKAGAVMVTHHPPGEVRASATLLAGQFRRVWIVDNGSGPAFDGVLNELARLPSTTLVRLPSNWGIAAALNVGMTQLLDCGARWVALFDQDTWIPPGYLTAMLETWRLCPQAERLGLLAPDHVQRGSGEDLPLRPALGSTCRLVRTAISSGSLVCARAYRAVGGFDESLFIDYVDFDFCLRLRRAGYVLGRVPGIRVSHSLGEGRVVRLGPCRLRIRSHRPWRYYYIFRNRILMYRRFWVADPVWCLHDLFWFLLDGLKAGLLEKERKECVRWMMQGIRDGLSGRRGIRVLPPGRLAGPEFLTADTGEASRRERTCS